MALEKELDGRLLKEFARAQERTQKGKLAIGVPDAPQDEKIGFMPRAIRMGKSLIAEQELSELDQTFRDYMKEYSRTANFKDIQTRNRSTLDMKQRFGKLRDTLFTQGLAFQKKIEMEKLDAKSEAFMWGEYGKVVEGLGKSFVLYGLKSPGSSADPITQGGIRTGQGTILPADYGGTTPGSEFAETYNIPLNKPTTPKQSGFGNLLNKLGLDWTD